MSNTISDNLIALSVAKNDIATAITNKGVTVPSGSGLLDFPTLINSITNTYTSSDEGKVVSNGSLINQVARPSSITTNGTYVTTNYNSITVNVPTSTVSTLRFLNINAYNGASQTGAPTINLNTIIKDSSNNSYRGGICTINGWNAGSVYNSSVCNKLFTIPITTLSNSFKLYISYLYGHRSYNSSRIDTTIDNSAIAVTQPTSSDFTDDDAVFKLYATSQGYDVYVGFKTSYSSTNRAYCTIYSIFLTMN